MYFSNSHPQPWLGRAWLLALAAIGTGGAVLADIPNGDFSSGLDAWTAAGDTAVVAQEARLGDRTVGASQLHQVARLHGPSVLRFEWQASLSAVVPQGRGPDAFFATLYYADQREGFSLVPGGFAAAQPLLDQDRDGLNAYGATVTAASRPGWLRYTILLPGSHRFVAPVFELYGDNLIGNDSLVQLDNVSLLPVQTTIIRIGFTNGAQQVVVDFEQEGGDAGRYQLEGNADPTQSAGWAPTPGAVITQLRPGVFQAVAPRAADFLLYRIGAAAPRITGMVVLPGGGIGLTVQDFAHTAGQLGFEGSADPSNPAGWAPVTPTSVTPSGGGLFTVVFPPGTPGFLRVVIP